MSKNLYKSNNNKVVNDITGEMPTIPFENISHEIIKSDIYPTLSDTTGSNVSIAFIEGEGEKGIRPATMTIVSNDPTEPSTILQMSGGYMTWREDTNELSFQQIANAFGYTYAS